jgi:hypothetical protein
MRLACTASSGAYEAQLAATAAQNISAGQAPGSAEVMEEVIVELDPQDHNLAQHIFNNSMFMGSYKSISTPRYIAII